MRAVELMEMLGDRARHSVVSMSGNASCRELVDKGIALDVLATPPPLSFFRAGAHMRDVIAAQQPDLVLTYNWGAIETVLGAKRSRDKVALVHHEDGFGPEESDRQLL